MLARAVGSKVEKEVREMLEPMFNAGLSPELTSALRTMAIEIPGLQREIQGGCGQVGVAQYVAGRNMRVNPV